MGFLVDLFNWFDVIHGTERIPTTTREREREKEREREREREKENIYCTIPLDDYV